MRQLTELERITAYQAGEPPPPVCVVVSADAKNAKESLAKMQDVMRLVAAARGAWLDDLSWKQSLPRWFLQTFEGKSLEQIEADPAAWDFGSWLDAMKAPGWEWWSSSLGQKGWVVNLCAFEDPFSVGPFEYLARAAGAIKTRVSESD